MSIESAFAGVRLPAAAILLGLGVAVSCYQDEIPSKLAGAGGKSSTGGTSGTRNTGGAVLPPPAAAGAASGEDRNPGSAGSAGDDIVNPADFCDPISSSERLPARSAAMSSEAPTAGGRLVATADLFNRFKSFCGGCHAESMRAGAFQDQPVDSIGKFIQLVEEDTLDSMRSNDPVKMMPPASVGGIPWSQRAADDPVVQFANLLAVWMQAGKPAVSFELPAAEGSEEKPYLFTPELGEALTNIGNCLPQASIIATETDKSVALDEKFAALNGFADLPVQLQDTDLYTFDSARLASHGVVAFAPSYPLWSDDAGKMRHVRVPRGESIHYDRATREFTIPPNTRFYKTFLKRVIDTEGRESHRKIETRLIVARPDDCSEPPCRVTAIMATYAWDEDETRGARLVTEPLRNGEPFADRVFTYATDELKLAALLANGAPTAEELRSVTRHYAIPGSTRCLQCHEGSSNDSGILGFTPMQINRWPYVEEPDLHASAESLRGHGILPDHAPKGDEFSQLQRLIDYGVITGLESPDEVIPLKESQAEPPRNGYELLAQGYMLGNCAHCHNPEGYPSRVNPELAPLMNFYPSPDGGIFQFPLERYSPRMRRGAEQSLESSRIPYVTPSLRDYRYIDGDSDTPASSGIKRKHYRQPRADNTITQVPVDAPWRSFIYRNVDAPFTYADDFAIFPHMPMNAAGFDCNAPRVMANWMLSIPARLKSKAEAAPYDADNEEAQPYESVPGDHPSFQAEVVAARRRVLTYQKGARFNYCPDTSDVQAPEVLAGTSQQPSSKGYDPPGSAPGLSTFSAGIPDRAHWVVTDLTDVPPPWSPRRPDWAAFLGKASDTTQISNLDEAQRKVLDVFKSENVRLTDELRHYATQEIPFGFWEERPECSETLRSTPTLLALLETGSPPRWSGVVPPEWVAPPRRPSDRPSLQRSQMQKPLYWSSPGAAVFNQICSNCHGPLGNGDSINANTILNLTGGDTRVANLKDGFLKPSNREVFALEARNLGISTDDLAGRYLAWMALGGTQRTIPNVIVSAIGNIKVFGQVRPWNAATGEKISGNMLETAKLLCQAALMTYSSNRKFNALQGPSEYEALFKYSGDLGVWQRLCAIGQKPVIFMIESTGGWDEPASFFGSGVRFCKGSESLACRDEDKLPQVTAVYDATAYGEAKVMTIASPTYVLGESPTDTDTPGSAQAIIKPANRLNAAAEPVAWCLRRPQPIDYTQLGSTGEPMPETFDEARYLVAVGRAEKFAVDNAIGGEPLPFCPEPLKPWSYDAVQQWPLRGAMNAGLAVFAYLQNVADRTKAPTLQWDECSKLSGNE